MARVTTCDELNIGSKCDVDKYIAGLYNRFSFHTTTRASIETLPTFVLIEICSFLQPQDLVNLAASSRVWYFPAIKTLYKKIIVTDNLDALHSVKMAITKCYKNCGTVISASKFQELLITIGSNPYLASFVKSLTLNVNEETINLMPLLSNIPGLQLRTLIAPQIPVAYFTRKNSLDIRSIKRLAISSKYVGSEPLCFTQLESLKIYYNENQLDQQNLRKLGKMLRKGRSLWKLRELEFAEHACTSKLALLNLFNDELDMDALPTWTYFFDYVIKGKKPKKLLLDSLAIEGFVGDKAVECVEKLSEAVELSELFNLQLHIREQSQTQSTASINSIQDSAGQFLDLITQRTPSLESLAITPTADFLIYQKDSIIKTLTVNLRHQLKNLLLVYESISADHSQIIHEAICKFQSKMERLLINDRSTEAVDRQILLKCIQSNQSLLSLYEHGLLYEQMFIDFLFSDTFLTDFLKLDEDFIINDHMLQFIERTSGKGLNDFLWCFLNFNFSPVVSHNSKLIEQLSHLKYLNVLGISLVVRFRNGHLNDQLQELYYNTNGGLSIPSGLAVAA
ncbi:hypothetical protein Cantr_10616 [Candida viswanathii]|uniref:F-box domain-containing protein n=1 Tax=Candida viswanathii TaxID=5486 RepID=A0A367YD22_9ASCO|nr:hypothetical protein Cantr_10616 [Candida viswanathii]